MRKRVEIEIDFWTLFRRWVIQDLKLPDAIDLENLAISSDEFIAHLTGVIISKKEPEDIVWHRMSIKDAKFFDRLCGMEVDTAYVMFMAFVAKRCGGVGVGDALD